MILRRWLFDYMLINGSKSDYMIRRAKEKDVEVIQELLVQVLKVHNDGRPDIFKKNGYKYTKDELIDIIQNDCTPVFVYENDKGEVLGHCFCIVNDNREKCHSYAYKNIYIDDLCVKESERGKGIGKALYQFVKEYALRNEFHNVTLHAWECNQNAVNFYKSLGMKIQQYTFEEVLEE